MPEFYSLEQPDMEKAKELTKELQECPELHPGLTFPFTLDKERTKALEMMKTGKIDAAEITELLKSDDFAAREAALYLIKEARDIPRDIPKECSKKILSLLEKIGEKISRAVQESVIEAKIKIIVATESKNALPVLKEMVKDKNAHLQKTIAEALAGFGKDGLPILEEMGKDKRGPVQLAVAKAKIKIIVATESKNALPILERISKSEDCLFREAVAEALAGFGKEALPILEKMSEDGEWTVRDMVAEVLSNFGKEALPILRKMVRKETNTLVRMRIAKTFCGFGEDALPVLEEMGKGKDKFVQKAAFESIEAIKESKELKKLKKFRWLLATQKPLFATPYTKELSKKILTIQEIVEKLKNEHKNDFVGVVIFGSTSKGYFTEESDLDYGIIAKNSEIAEKFYNMAQSQGLGAKHYGHHISFDEKNQVQENEDVLFHGLFFGDRKRLREIQKQTLESMDEEKWDSVKENILYYETNLIKAAKRFNIKEKELERIIRAAVLLRVPPPYKEALKIVSKRVRNPE